MKKNKPILILAASLLAGLLVSCRGGDSPSSVEPTPSSSSEEPAAKYAVTLVQVEGITIASDKAEAEAGETVAITITGYDAKGVTPTPTATPEVTFAPKADYDGEGVAYTFTMPASAVTISATLEAIDYKATVDFLTTTSTTPTYTWTAGGEAATADALPAGSEVTLTATGLGSGWYGPSAGDTFYLYIGEEVLSATAAADDDSVLSVTYTFTMPSNDLDLVICQAGGTLDADAGYSVTYSLPASGFKAYGAKAGDKYSGSFDVYIVTELGYMLDDDSDEAVTYTIGDSMSSDYIWMSQSSYRNDLFTGTIGSYYFKGDAAITVSGEYKGAKNITWVNTEDIVSVNYDENFSFPTSATVGADLSFSYITAVEGKYVSHIKIVGADETVILDKDQDYFYFTMPDQDVTITFTYGDAASISWDSASTEHLDEYFVSTEYSYSDAAENKITSSKPGAYLYAYIKPASGYKATSLTITCGEGDTATTTEKTFYSSYGNEGVYYASFTMPSGGDVTLTVAVSQIYNVSVADPDSNGCGLTVSTSSYGAGETASVSMTRPDKYWELDALVANYGGKDHSLTEITYTYGVALKEGQYYVYSSYVCFYMPAADVTLKPTFKESEGVVKFTVSYNEGISSATARSKDTYSYWQPTAAGDTGAVTGKAYSDENIALSATASDSSKIAYALVTYSDSSTETLTPTSVNVSSSGVSCSFDQIASTVTVTSGEASSTKTVSSIVFGVTARQSATATVTNDTDATLTYSINGSTVTDLSGLLVGDTLTITTSAAESGYKYVVTVKDADGNELEADYYGDYTITGNVTITITKVEAYTISVSYSTTDISHLYGSVVVNGSSYYSFDELADTTLSKGDVISFRTISLYDSNLNTISSWTMTVDNAGETTSYTQDTYSTASITIKGSVTIALAVSSSSSEE